MTCRPPRMLVTILLLVAAGSSGACARIGAGDGSDNRSGAGMNYRGTFYNLSSFEVDPGSLGPLLDRQVPFQDTRIDVRRIRGVAPSRAVAGFTDTFPGTGSPQPRAWLLLSPDATLAADPRTDALLRTVVLSPDRG